jgi:hypothetical protein
MTKSQTIATAPQPPALWPSQLSSKEALIAAWARLGRASHRETGEKNTYNDKMADGHAYSSNHKSWLAAPAINVHDCGNSGYKHDNANNARSKKGDGIVRETEVAKNYGCVVKDGINTSPPGI